MRKADLKKNHQPFDRALARYRSFTERIISAQRVISKKTEKEDLVESVLLRLCANWERFVDEHLVDCVNVDHSKLNDFLGVPIPRNPTRNLCEALLIGANYLDFRSFGDLKGFSRKVLHDGSNPFLAVAPSHINKIDEAFKLRNYLVHYSGAARRSLDRMYKDVYKLKKFVEPGRFLIAYDARRLWKYFDAFERASQDMKGWY
ncbi:hypothetical protein MYX82_12475 [Acidobacteria bacterium AH-259-D05]|nr:hypothetical protein [Acidobacteria bacterium AH-259-D05]